MCVGVLGRWSGVVPLFLLLPCSAIISGSYNNFFRIFYRNPRMEYCYEASRDMSQLGQILRNRKVVTGPRRRRDEVGIESLDYPRRILHAVWHPRDNILAIAATNNLYLFHEQQPHSIPM